MPDTTLEIDDKEEIRKIMRIIPKRELKLILEYFDKANTELLEKRII